MSTTIVLVDDHSEQREGLTLLLESKPNYQVLPLNGDARSIASNLRHLRQGVLVMDLIAPDPSILKSVFKIHDRVPEIRVLYFAMVRNFACVMEAGTTESIAYTLEAPTTKELVHAISEVIEGRQQFRSNFYAKVGKVERGFKANLSEVDSYNTLTTREREVLHLVGQGLSSAEIANLLVISPRTVDMHRWHIMRKLKLRGQAALARYAIGHGLVPQEN
ncbi:MAG TPA: response regulator transcription factor [Anaerolineaceae bacterium]|nr:response regulator transcription factor [Anaerolineaceae bacterium]